MSTPQIATGVAYLNASVHAANAHPEAPRILPIIKEPLRTVHVTYSPNEPVAENDANRYTGLVSLSDGRRSPTHPAAGGRH